MSTTDRIGGDMSQETRDFYRWFEGQWLGDAMRMEENPPTRFLLSELEHRGERIQRVTTEAEQLREDARALEQEVERLRVQDAYHVGAVARLNAQVEQLMKHVSELEDKAASPEVVDASLRQRAEDAEQRLAEMVRLRREEGDRYRELFGEKDNRVHTLEQKVAELEVELHPLAPERTAGWFTRILGS